MNERRNIAFEIGYTLTREVLVQERINLYLVDILRNRLLDERRHLSKKESEDLVLGKVSWESMARMQFHGIKKSLVDIGAAPFARDIVNWEIKKSIPPLKKRKWISIHE